MKDQLVNKMYFHRILASAITSNVFTVLFNFIITTAVACVPKLRHPVPVCRITGQTNKDKHNTEASGFSKAMFWQK